MYRVDNPTGTQTLPPPTAPTATPDRYYSAGSESTGAPATIVEAEHLNMIQEELINAVVAGGQTPSKSLRDQLAKAVAAQIEAVATNTAIGRNLILNGSNDVRSRGYGPWTTNGAMTLDRWRMQFTSGTMNVRRQHLGEANYTATPGVPPAPGGAFTITFSGAATANTYTRYQTVIDAWRVHKLKLMVSFWAWANAALRVGVNISEHWGTRNDIGVGQSVQVTATPQRYVIIIDHEARPDAPDPRTTAFASVNFWLSASTQMASQSGSVGVQSGTVSLAGIQMEKVWQDSVTGGAAFEITEPTPWSPAGPDEDSMCQRYYQQIGLYIGHTITPATNNLAFLGTISLLRQMLFEPTVTVSGTTVPGSLTVMPNGDSALGYYIDGQSVWTDNAVANVSAEPSY